MGNSIIRNAIACDFEDPLEIDGSIIIRDGGETVALLPGSEGEVLRIVTGIPAWSPDGSGSVTDVTLINTGLNIEDTGADHTLRIRPNEDYTANRVLNLTINDADRTLTLQGNPTLDDWFDQEVKTTSGPTFDSLDVTNNITVGGTVDGIDIAALDAEVSLNTADRHVPVTIGTANGLSLSTQELSLALSSIFTTGALSSTDWNIFNNKSDYADPLTTNGDIVIRSGGTTTRLGIGADNQILAVSSGIPSWQDASSGGVITSVTLDNDGLKVYDTGGDHTLQITPNEDFTANRILNLVLNDADRTITLQGSPTLDDWFDQEVKETSDVQHRNLDLYDPTNDGNPQFNIGSSATDALKIQSVYNTGTQELDYVEIMGSTTGVASSDGELRLGTKGITSFNVGSDEVKVTIENFTLGQSGSSNNLIQFSDVTTGTNQISFATPSQSDPTSNSGWNLYLHQPGAEAASSGLGTSTDAIWMHAATNSGIEFWSGGTEISSIIPNTSQPQFKLGISDTEAFFIETAYTASQLDSVTFNTKTASATVNKGEYSFKVDEVERFTITDSGAVVPTDDLVVVTGNIIVGSGYIAVSDTLGLNNINTIPITDTQWGYVGNMNQNVATSNNVTFVDVTATGDVSVDGDISAGGLTPLARVHVGDGTNEDLIYFDTERKWKFTAGGTGATTSLDLLSLSDNKEFRIGNQASGNFTSRYKVGTTTTDDYITMVESGGRVAIGKTSVSGTALLQVDGEIEATGVVSSKNDFLFSRRTTTQSIANNTNVAVDFTFNLKNEGFSTTTGTSFTFPKDGLYEITYKIAWDNNSTGRREAWMEWDADTDIRYGHQATESPTNTIQSGAALVNVSSGDALSVKVFQNSGAARDVAGATSRLFSYVQIYFLGQKY